MKVDGACHCGQLSFEAEVDPEKVGICHCTDCQTLTGSAFSLFVPVPRAALRLRGEPRLYVKTAESGSRRAQAFCGQCGTRVYASADEPEPQVFNLRVGTVRQRAQLPPRMQLWCRSSLPWVMALGAVKQSARQ